MAGRGLIQPPAGLHFAIDTGLANGTIRPGCPPSRPPRLAPVHCLFRLGHLPWGAGTDGVAGYPRMAHRSLEGERWRGRGETVGQARERLEA